MNEQLNDNELFSLLASGDRKAFTMLYTSHVNNLYRYIYSFCGSKDTSEEIVQHVFVSVWKKRGELEHIVSFKSYLYRCAKNHLLNHIKKEQTQAKIINMTQVGLEISHETSDANIIYQQNYKMAQKAINLLPEKRKQIFKLRTEDDLSLDEIAQKLSISKSVVKKQLYIGRDFIKNYLKKAGVLTVDIIFILIILSL